MTIAASPVATTVARRDPRELMTRLQSRFGASMLAANFDGAAIVFIFLGFLLPRHQRYAVANFAALFGYGIFSFVVGCAWSARKFAPIRQWVLDGHKPDPAMRTYVVRHPLRQAGINFSLWLVSELVFVPVNIHYGLKYEGDVASAIFMGGLSTCGVTYLLAERIMRPIHELAFVEGLPPDPYVPGVKTRLMSAWLIGSGVPIFGIVLMSLDHGHQISPGALGFLAVVALASGALAMAFAAKSIADPVEEVTAALADVEAGRLDVAVPVYDGSQVGQLQAGFNAMVDGLRERRQLRDLFGRQVGEHVARHALQRGVRLGGEQVHAAVLFVDVIGSTSLAATRAPNEVVAALNEFFAIVVDVVDRTGGIVNKFEGDAALCVFGAPVPRHDADSCALLAARLLRDRLTDVSGLSAAIGVSSGVVVAGNVGTKERFEYTVIGDAVNEAARLTELAKMRPERLLVSASMLGDVADEERERWQLAGEALLRGRTQPTPLAVA